MIKKSILGVLVLASGMMGSGLLYADSVSVNNHSGVAVTAETYNGDDSVCMFHHSVYLMASGDTKSVSCAFGGKNKCKVQIKQDSNNDELCTLGQSTHNCGSRTHIVYVSNNETLTVNNGSNCAVN